MLNNHFSLILLHHHLPTFHPISFCSQSLNMTTIPADNPEAEYLATATDLADYLKAEYVAAVAAFEQQAALIPPARKEYKTRYMEHKRAHKGYLKTVKELHAHRTTFQRHKQYFISLSNDLLASNITMRSTTGPISDLQALTHATLLNHLRHAYHTFMAIILEDKHLTRLEKKLGKHDRDLGAQCEEVFEAADKDLEKLERLHADITKVEAKMGREPACGSVGGKCSFCIRLEEQEATRRAKLMPAEKVKKEKKGKRVSMKSLKKGLEVKGRLESIPEEEELSDGFGNWV